MACSVLLGIALEEIDRVEKATLEDAKGTRTQIQMMERKSARGRAGNHLDFVQEHGCMRQTNQGE
jgi:hypothetical protein